MNVTPRSFSSYTEALTIAYEDEISGEVFFDALAGFHSGRAAEAFSLMARMEAATAAALAPLADRNRLSIRDRGTLRAEGAEEARTLRDVNWAEFLVRIRDDYPAYVQEFRDVVALAPPADRALAKILVDHEQAMIDFAHAELADDPDSHAVLTAFLGRLNQAGPAA